MSKPRFLADENMAAPLVSALREAGWDSAYVAESRPGISDDAVLHWAGSEGRILLTEDKDFGELVFRMKRNIPGVLMLRMPDCPWPQRWTRLEAILRRHSDRLEGAFVVIRVQTVRFRPIV